MRAVLQPDYSVSTIGGGACMPCVTALLGLSAQLGRDVALGFGAADTHGRNVIHMVAAECEMDEDNVAVWSCSLPTQA